MRIITFYSYKGGVGRTLSLANIAIRLARLGKKVITLDFDLEAPGLHHKWNLDPRRPSPLVIERGLIDILYDFVTKEDVPTSLERYLLDVSEPGDDRGTILFLPAGTAPSPAYAKRLARIDWHALFYRPDAEGVFLFLELKEMIREHYAPDFLLIDARTGVTEMGGVATSVLADHVFALMLNNDEHLEGSRAVMRGMLAAPRVASESPIKIGAILARYPRTRDATAEAHDKEKVRAYLNEPAGRLDVTLSISDVALLRADPGLARKEELLILGTSEGHDNIPLYRDYIRLCEQILPSPERSLAPAPVPASVPHLLVPVDVLSPEKIAALDLAIKRCRRGTPARKLLEGAAVFAPDAVPLDWAEAAAGLKPGGSTAREARETLMGIGLIQMDEGAQTLSMHPQIQQRARERASTKTWPAKNRRAAARVAKWLVQIVDPTRMADVDARRAHIEAALEAAERSGSEIEWIVIASQMATHLNHRAAYDEARTWAEKALARTERLKSKDPVFFAVRLSILAIVLKNLGQAAEAKPLLEQALAIAETTYGPQHHKVTSFLSNLAIVLQDLGQVAEAKPLLEQALAIDETTYGPQHHKVASFLSNLAQVLLDLGQAAEAKPLLERALAIDETTYGPQHHEVATDLSNLATVLLHLGQVAEAKPLLERALAIDETTYGPQHPMVARVLSNLAMTLKDLGQQAEALPLLDRALAIAEKTLPLGHPLQAAIAKNLASF